MLQQKEKKRAKKGGKQCDRHDCYKIDAASDPDANINTEFEQPIEASRKEKACIFALLHMQRAVGVHALLIK